MTVITPGKFLCPQKTLFQLNMKTKSRYLMSTRWFLAELFVITMIGINPLLIHGRLIELMMAHPHNRALGSHGHDDRVLFTAVCPGHTV